MDIRAISILRYEHREHPTKHIAYQISLTGSVRRWTVWRRYSEFEAFHNTFLQLYPHVPPPTSLPPKSLTFLGFPTSSDPTKINERRIGLERYLNAMLESPDDRWRTTKEWATFLGAAAPADASSNQQQQQQQLSGMNGVAAARSEAWMEEFRKMQAECRAIRQLVSQRDRHAASGDIAKTQSVGIQSKKALAAVVMRIDQLEAQLKDEVSGRSKDETTGPLAASSAAGKVEGIPSNGSFGISLVGGLWGAKPSPVTSSAMSATVLSNPPPPSALSKAEILRREDLLVNLREESDKISQLINASRESVLRNTNNNNEAPSTPQKSSSPFIHSSVANKTPSSAVRSSRKFGNAPPQETEVTRGLDNQQLLQLHRQTMAEQDEALGQLSNIIRRQYEIGVTIGDELDHHNQLLGELDEGVDRASESLKNAGKKLDKVSGNTGSSRRR